MTLSKKVLFIYFYIMYIFILKKFKKNIVEYNIKKLQPHYGIAIVLLYYLLIVVYFIVSTLPNRHFYYIFIKEDKFAKVDKFVEIGRFVKVGKFVKVDIIISLFTIS